MTTHEPTEGHDPQDRPDADREPPAEREVLPEREVHPGRETAAPGAGGPPPRAERRTPWLALAGTATAAALVASLATAGLTGAFDADVVASPAAVEQRSIASTGTSVSTVASPDWQGVADAVRASVVAIDVRTAQGSGQGSGVVVDEEGHVLTNHHVVGAAVDGGLQVTLADGRVLQAELVGSDPTTDLAVIRLLDATGLEPAELGDSTGVVVGQPVMAVGNPLGLASTVTTGVVSALDRPVTTSDGTSEAVVTNAIQVDAAINPGNSGGPLFDAQGRVIGITSSIASMSNGAGGSTGSIGLGFAIPSNLAERVARELVADGTVEHAFLGVGLGDGTATVDTTTRRGAVVQQVTEGSPAADAGLAEGDVVVAIDGRAVEGAESLTGFVRAGAADQEVTLTVVRDGRASDVPVTLAVRPAAQETEQQPTRPGSWRDVDPRDLPELFGR